MHNVQALLIVGSKTSFCYPTHLKKKSNIVHIRLQNHFMEEEVVKRRVKQLTVQITALHYHAAHQYRPLTCLYQRIIAICITLKLPPINMLKYFSISHKLINKNDNDANCTSQCVCVLERGMQKRERYAEEREDRSAKVCLTKNQQQYRVTV